MKHLITILVLLFTTILSAQSATVNTPVGKSNVTTRGIDLDKKASKPKTFADLEKNAVKTEYVAVYKSTEHTIYQTKNNKYFIITTSKAGNLYRKYLKEEDINI